MLNTYVSAGGEAMSAGQRCMMRRDERRLPHIRPQIEEAIERLLQLLDDMDGDADLEDADPAESGIADIDGLSEQMQGVL